MEVLEKFFYNCFLYWKRCGNDEREAYKKALEYDIVEIYHANGKCMHNPFTPCGEVLPDAEVKQFIKNACMNLYGKDYEVHLNGYNL